MKTNENSPRGQLPTIAGSSMTRTTHVKQGTYLGML